MCLPTHQLPDTRAIDEVNYMITKLYDYSDMMFAACFPSDV